ncbi:hypothetical protein N7488_007443, partial [Penicillium malachiteum]
SGKILTILVSLVTFYVFKIARDYARLKQFKGPSWTGISNWPHSIAFLRGNCHEWYADILNKYDILLCFETSLVYQTDRLELIVPELGPITRVAPNILITSSPDVWMHVKTKPGYKRSDWYYRATRIEYQRDNVFSQTDNEKMQCGESRWLQGENLHLEESIDEQVQDLLNLIRSKYFSTDRQVIPMDLAKKLQYLTLDVISSIGLGKKFGMLKSDKDVDSYLESSEEGLAMGNTALALGFSWISQAPFIGRFILPSPKDKIGFGKMMTACFRIVDERAGGSIEGRSDILASFMRHGIAGDDLRSEALEQIIAGSDTSAGAIRGTLLHILTNPRVYFKLQHEIDNAVRQGHAPSAGEGLITTVQVKKLPYLQAVISEALRIWAPVTNIFSRDVPEGGGTVVVGGENVFLPGGVCIGYSAYAMHHSEEIYGPDAKIFRPERWLESDPAKLAEMVQINGLSFGYGNFQCLGKPVAQIEIGKTIFELLRHFDLALINPTHPWKIRNLLGLFAISDMWVQVMERVSCSS